MRVQLRSVALVAFTVVAACHARFQRSVERPASRRSPEVFIFAAVVDTLFPRAKQDTLLVSDSTMAAQPFTWSVARRHGAGDSLPAGLAEALEDSVRVRRRSEHLSLPGPLRVLSATERKEIFTSGVRSGWEEFYRRFPRQRQFALFSPIGYSNDASSALVFVAYSCGGRCGASFAVWLSRRADGTWYVRQIIQLGVA